MLTGTSFPRPVVEDRARKREYEVRDKKPCGVANGARNAS
jgi:hypothetical protein